MLFIVFIFSGTGCRLNEISKPGNREKLEKYNVTWDTPSENSMGSMPAGNGDIGINLWENGDLLFYLSKTDAWSENCRLLKIGKVRLSLSPSPFMEGTPFLQELDVTDGMIHIVAGEDKERRGGILLD